MSEFLSHDPEMPAAAAADPQSAADRWQLRVFSGLHADAAAVLEADAWCLVGQAGDCDLILRDAAVARHHFVLFVRDGKVALRAVDAHVQMSDRSIGPGDTCMLESAAAMAIGNVAMAVGLGQTADWDALRAGAAALVQPVAPQTSMSELAPDAAGSAADALSQAAAAAAPPAARPARWWRIERHHLRWAPALAAVVLLTAAGSAALVWSNHNQASERLHRLQQAVAAFDLPEVRVEQGPHGGLRVVGTVPTEAQRSELVSALKREGLLPSFDLVTGEHLAQGVENSFRQRGVRVDAVYAGDGEVHLSGIADTPEAVTVVREILAANGTIRAVKFADATAAAAPPTTDSPAAPGAAGAAAANLRDPKRIVAVVGGQYAFLLTRDGTRYTQGALLPDGSKVESIDGHDVVFERNGQRVVVQF
jgi:type III secretion system YscD/HrpQ family protein